MGKPFYAYMLVCADDSYYVGHTDDLRKRIGQHQAGDGANYTKSRRPVRLIWSATFQTREEAKWVETQIKHWNRAKKASLVEGRFDLIQRLAGRSRESRTLRKTMLGKAPRAGVRSES